MNLTLMMITSYMFILATLAYILESKHLLSSLACLEFLALIIFISLSSSTYFICNELFHSLLYIAIAVCEAALGLSITVVYVNKKGNEILKTF